MRRLISAVSASVVLLFVIAYLLSPVLLEWLAIRVAQEQGIKLSVQFERPSVDHLRVTNTRAQLPGYEISIHEIDAYYDLDSLLEQRLRSLNIESLDIEAIKTTDESVAAAEIPSPWRLLPSDSLRVNNLTAILPGSSIKGTLAMTPEVAEASLLIESELVPTTVELHATLDPLGSITMSAGQQGVSKSLSVTTSTDQGKRILDGVITLSGETFTLASQLLLDQALEGNFKADFTLATAWPIDLETLLANAKATGHAEFNVVGPSAFPIIQAGEIKSLEGAAISGSMQFNLAEGLLSTSADKVDIQAQSLITSSGRLPLTDGSRLTASFETSLPATSLYPALSLEQAQAHATLSLDAGIDGVLTLPVNANISEPQIKGVFGVNVNSSHVQMTSDKLQLFASAVSYAGTDYQLSPESRLSFQFDASTDWPLAKNLLPAIKAQVASDLDLRLSWNEPAATHYALAISGSLSTLVADGKVAATVSDGLHLEFTDAESAVSVAGKSTFTIHIDLESMHFSTRDVALVARTGALDFMDGQLNYRGARIAIHSMTMEGEEVEVAGSAKADSSAKALPMDFSLQTNLTSRTTQYRLSADHRISRALLKNELPGWRSNYDLAAGDLNFFLEGHYQPAQTGQNSTLEGRGILGLKQGVAYYDDLVAADIAAEFELVLTSDTLRVMSPKVQIGSIDVGFPVIDMGFSLGTDFDLVSASNITATALGGQFSIDRLDYDIDEGASKFNLMISNLPLANLLALEGEDIIADGILDGVIPLTLENDLPGVTSGRLTARPPGGWISFTSDMPAVNPQLALALRALRDFKYSLLNADLDYTSDGTLETRVRLEGHSPAVENGRPVHFNLNVSENIPVLLESLRTAQTVEERVQQLLSR